MSDPQDKDCWNSCPYIKDREGLWKTMNDLRALTHQIDKSQEVHNSEIKKMEERMDMVMSHVSNRLDAISASLVAITDRIEKSSNEMQKAEGRRDGVKEANRKWAAVVSTVVVIALGSGGFVRFSQGSEEPFFREERQIHEQQQTELDD